MRRGLTLGLLFLIAVGIGGCGSGHIPVTGVVTFNGAPVSGAQVSFISEDGKNVFTGFTADNGNFEIVSSQSKGALPGMYKVTVVKSPKGASAEGTNPGDGDYMKDMMAMTKESSKNAPGKGLAGGGPPPGMGAGMMKPGGAAAGTAMMMPGGAGGPITVKSDLPQVYAQGATTTLKVTIPHEGPVMLELKGDVKKDKDTKKP